MEDIIRRPQDVPFRVHQGELMETLRFFGLNNQAEFSANSVLKANKWCWSLKPAFFINDERKNTYLSTRLAGIAEILFSTLEERPLPIE